MIEVQDRPQLLLHIEKSLNVTIYDTKSVLSSLCLLLCTDACRNSLHVDLIIF